MDYKVPEFIKTYMNNQYKNIEIIRTDNPYPSKALHNFSNIRSRFSLDNNTFDLQTLELIKYWNKYYGFEN
jgi:hypothetical protein